MFITTTLELISQFFINLLNHDIIQLTTLLINISDPQTLIIPEEVIENVANVTSKCGRTIIVCIFYCPIIM